MPARIVSKNLLACHAFTVVLTCTLLAQASSLGDVKSKYVLVHAFPVSNDRIMLGTSEVDAFTFPETPARGVDVCRWLSSWLQNRDVVVSPETMETLRDISIESTGTEQKKSPLMLFESLGRLSATNGGSAVMLEPLIVSKAGIRLYYDRNLYSFTDTTYPVRLCLTSNIKLDWKLFTKSCIAFSRSFCGGSITISPTEDEKEFWTLTLPNALTGEFDKYRTEVYLPDNGLVVFKCDKHVSPNSDLDSDYPTFFRHVLTGDSGSAVIIRK